MIAVHRRETGVDTSFARKLIEQPGEATTRQLFSEVHAGIFWVDWREADNYIVTLAARAIGRDDLRADWIDGKLTIDFSGRRTEVPLQGKPGEQDVTLDSLNRALGPEFGLRYVRASEGGDTLAFMVLPQAVWREFEASHGDRLPQAFAPIDLQAPLFAHEELPPGAMDAVYKQMGSIHFQRVAVRVISHERAAALVNDPARAGSAKPVVDTWSGDLALTYFHDLIGGDHEDITEGELLQYGTSREQLSGQALDNTGATMGSFVLWPRDDGLHKIDSKDKFVASTLVLSDDFWEGQARSLGPMRAAFAHRDVVLYAGADRPEAVAALLEALDIFGAPGCDGLSRHLHAWGPDGWQVHPAGPAERSFRKSFNWLQAERGNLRAQFEIAMLYQFMELYAESVKWYYKAAVKAATVPRTSDDMYENGSACQCNLADKYEHGLGVPQDYKKALYWYGKSAAMGNEVAQYSLGHMYLDGRGVAKDAAQARSWFEKSAARGYEGAVTALKNLG